MSKRWRLPFGTKDDAVATVVLDHGCMKKAFRYHIEAWLFAERTRYLPNKNPNHYGVVRVYRCKNCHQFHITTKPCVIKG